MSKPKPRRNWSSTVPKAIKTIPAETPIIPVKLIARPIMISLSAIADLLAPSYSWTEGAPNILAPVAAAIPSRVRRLIRFIEFILVVCHATGLPALPANRTHAPQQTASLFDRLVGAGEQRGIRRFLGGDMIRHHIYFPIPWIGRHLCPDPVRKREFLAGVR